MKRAAPVLNRHRPAMIYLICPRLWPDAPEPPQLAARAILWPASFVASTALAVSRPIPRMVLPQALKQVIAPIVNLAIGIFQDTTLVAIIGMFDLLNAARAAATDPMWIGFYAEAYVFAAAVYFIFCFTAARYSLWLERHLSVP